MANVLTEHLEQGILTDATQAVSGVAGALNGAKIRPFISAITPTAKTPLSDYTFSTDTGLAAISVTWGAPYRRSVGGLAIDGQAAQFQLADPANNCSVFGYVVEDGAAANALYAEVFDSPIPLADVLSALVVVPQFAVGGPDFGNASIIS